MNVLIRRMQEDDVPAFENEFNKPKGQYKRYFAEQQAGIRDVYLAEFEGSLAGYLTIVWESEYPPFREAQIPEVVDFNVVEHYRRQGIGSKLMDTAEAKIGEGSNVVGIGFGLMHDYGNAQIMYAKRGYVPDGRGIFAHGKWLNDGDQIIMGHDVALYLTKELTS